MTLWKNHGGSSLIEVMVGMILLAIGMMAGLGMNEAGSRGLDAGYRISRASGLAQAKMEEILAGSYFEMSRSNFPGGDEIDGFRRTWSIFPDTPGSHHLTLQVTVEWKDRLGQVHPLQVVTVRSKGVVP